MCLPLEPEGINCPEDHFKHGCGGWCGAWRGEVCRPGGLLSEASEMRHILQLSLSVVGGPRNHGVLPSVVDTGSPGTQVPQAHGALTGPPRLSIQRPQNLCLESQPLRLPFPSALVCLPFSFLLPYCPVCFGHSAARARGSNFWISEKAFSIKPQDVKVLLPCVYGLHR